MVCKIYLKEQHSSTSCLWSPSAWARALNWKSRCVNNWSNELRVPFNWVGLNRGGWFSCLVAVGNFSFCEEKDGFSTPPRQNKRRILQINGIKKCDRNIKCICGELAFQILKIAWFVAALPWQLELHLYGAHIENFGFSLFLRWKLLFTVNPAVILYQISPQMKPHDAHCNSRVHCHLHLGCWWAFFSARLPIFPPSFHRISFYFRYSWLPVAIWRAFRKHMARLQTTKVAKHLNRGAQTRAGQPNSN